MTRLHARYSVLLAGSEWQRLQRVEHFASFVQLARDTALRPWVLHFAPGLDVHVLEAALRSGYCRQVHEVAGWMPPSWRAAVRWIERLPGLPMVRHRVADGEAYAWMEPEADAGWHAAAGSDGVALSRLWQARWQALWPCGPAAPEFEELQRMQRQWQQAAVSLAGEGDEPLGRLEIALRRSFRNSRAAASMAFAYLGLLWLEVARLRGALVRRRLLDATAAGSSP